MVKVGDALNLVNGRAFKPSEWTKTGTPIVRIQNLNNPDAPFNYYQGELPAKIALDDGDLLFAWSGTPGTSFGAHIWRGGKAWLNQHIFKVEFQASQFDKSFLQLAINQNLAEYIRAAHGGAGLAHITKGKFEGSEIPVPPLAEQSSIVAEIEKQFTRLDAGVAALRRVQANLKRYRAAILKAACEGRLVPTEAQLARKEGRTFETGADLLARIQKERRDNWDGRGKHSEPKPANVELLSRLPEGWTWATVGQLADLGSGNTPAGITKYLRSSGGVPWFKVGDMNRPGNEQVMRSTERYLTQEDAVLLGLRIFPAGALIFPKRGGAIATNKKRTLEAPATTDLNVMALMPHVDVVSYFRRWFASIDLASLSDGSNVPQVNNKDIQPLPVPLPPLREQTRIVAEVERRLSVVQELEATVTVNLQRATRLRQSVLKSTFGQAPKHHARNPMDSR